MLGYGSAQSFFKAFWGPDSGP